MSKSDQESGRRDHRYTLTRTIDAPVAEVWQYWTSDDHLKHWFGPKGFEILEVQADLRVGGQWRTRMRSSDGGAHTTYGVYTDIANRSRLVMTQSWEDSTDQSEITVTLAEKGDGTEVVFEHRLLESGESRDSHAGGWSEALDNLERYVASSPTGTSATTT